MYKCAQSTGGVTVLHCIAAVTTSMCIIVHISTCATVKSNMSDKQ
jgi:hypothetical protein